MTSIIGRVPIDGRVTDPMQFKAVVGRDNLAANGFELPGDLAGMIVTGIAINCAVLACLQLGSSKPAPAAATLDGGRIVTLPTVVVHPTAAQWREVKASPAAADPQQANASAGADCLAMPYYSFAVQCVAAVSG